MPLMKSPAGDMEITIKSMTADNDQLVTTGKLGAWDSSIFFTADEVLDMVKLMLNRKVIGFILRLPLILAKKKLAGQGDSARA